MLYAILRALFRITNKFYFKTFQVKGAENIPKSGPVFFVANHPSAFMDPIVIATVINRPLYFLAKGALFQSKFMRWLLPKFHAIPIFRSNETPGQTHKNKDIFIQCYKHFENGGAILAFPEGVSLTERKIKKIQSGTARICLGAEAENNFSLDIKIITIGLNFSNPHKFQNDLFVNIDKPICLSEYYEANKKDSFKAAHALTDEIRVRLEKQVIAIQDSAVEKLVADIELIFKAQILKELGHSPKVMENDFNASRAISDSVHYFLERDPSRVETIKNQIDSYLNDLQRLSLSDDLIKGVGKSSPIFNAMKSLFFVVLGFPFFVYGVINSYLPFKIPIWTARAISKRPEFFGSIAFSMGTLTFLLFYSLQIWLVNKYTGDWRIVLTYGLSLPITGFFAHYYHKRYLFIRGNLKIFSMFYKKTTLITSLISKRESIINQLQKARGEYVAYRDGHLSSIKQNSNEEPEDVNNFFSLNI